MLQKWSNMNLELEKLENMRKHKVYITSPNQYDFLCFFYSLLLTKPAFHLIQNTAKAVILCNIFTI